MIIVFLPELCLKAFLSYGATEVHFWCPRGRREVEVAHKEDQLQDCILHHSLPKQLQATDTLPL